MQGVLLMLACSLLTAVAAALFKTASAWKPTGRHIPGVNPYVVLGLLVYVPSFACNMLAYRDRDISALLPLLHLSLVWTMLIAYFRFGEPLTRRMALGCGLILLGGVTMAWLG